MGREVTGVRMERTAPNAKVKPKVSAEAEEEVNPNSPEGSNEVKEIEVKECTSEVPRAENSCEDQDVLASKSTNVESDKPEVKPVKSDGQKSSSPVKATSETVSVVNVRTKSSPQKRSEALVEKQVCESPIAVETPLSPTTSNAKSPSSSAKKSQPSTPLTARKNYDDEDNWSVTSSTARSRTTVGVAPSFTVEERLEKRREYYAKLEEKRKALEEEKKEYEARMKEEEEANIKKMRKSMMFRANPVPNFYYEKPAPKKELKKLPTTRAVSPKFGRRKSFSDAATPSSEERVYGRALRHSLGGHTQSSTPTSTPKRKDQLVRDRSKQVRDTNKTASPKIREQKNADIAVQS